MGLSRRVESLGKGRPQYAQGLNHTQDKCHKWGTKLTVKATHPEWHQRLRDGQESESLDSSRVIVKSLNSAERKRKRHA